MNNHILHVLFLADEWGSSKGGMSTLNREMAKHFALLPNVKVTYLVPPGQNSKIKDEAIRYGVDLVEAEDYIGFDPSMLLSFPPSNLNTIDVVIGHSRKLGPQAQPIRASTKCKWVQVVHVSSEEVGMHKEAIREYEKKHDIEIKLCKTADLVVAIGLKLADVYNAALRFCDKTVEVLTPGVFEEFRNVRQGNTDMTTHGILVFGRGASEEFQLKGYDIAARAVGGMRRGKYHLIFVGAPEGEQEKVKKNLLESGIKENQLKVRSFRESRDELSRMFSEADLAIMPSRTEGFGLAALEAMSAGIPVLVTKNSGLAQALEKVSFGHTCIVDSDDPSVWRDRMEEVLEKPRHNRLEEAARIRDEYAAKYPWESECANVVEKIRHLLLSIE